MTESAIECQRMSIQTISIDVSSRGDYNTVTLSDRAIAPLYFLVTALINQ